MCRDIYDYHNAIYTYLNYKRYVPIESVFRPYDLRHLKTAISVETAHKCMTDIA